MRNLIVLSFIVLFGAMGITKAEAKNNQDNKVLAELEKNIEDVIFDPLKSEGLDSPRTSDNQLITCVVMVAQNTCSYMTLNNISRLTDAIYTDPKTKKKMEVCKVHFINLENTNGLPYDIATGTCASLIDRINFIHNMAYRTARTP